MSDVERSGEGKLTLTRDQARDRAKNFDGKDPFPYIPRALLSAGHIIEYAQKTGMISPLYEEGKRMKKASYQGCIGEKAYEFNDSKELVRIPMYDDKLIIKANSIVFVECDLDFRLPNFIAVRFNLHIRHVHRGLLLGTGPLVDPGYWGKLCIPLHNLTDENYPIRRDKGLIWVEFTKISNKPYKGREPSGTGFWDIYKFIERATKQYGTSPVSIRSSIPVAVQETRQLAYAARNFSKDARKSSNNAEAEVKNLRSKVYKFGVTGFLGVAISLGVIAYTAYNNIQSAYHFVESSLGSKLESNEDSIKNLRLRVEKMEEHIRNYTPKSHTTNLPTPKDRIP